jgi:ABC-type thiamine transport system ATPase subunit
VRADDQEKVRASAGFGVGSLEHDGEVADPLAGAPREAAAFARTLARQRPVRPNVVRNS